MSIPHSLRILFRLGAMRSLRPASAGFKHRTGSDDGRLVGVVNVIYLEEDAAAVKESRGDKCAHISPLVRRNVLGLERVVDSIASGGQYHICARRPTASRECVPHRRNNTLEDEINNRECPATRSEKNLREPQERRPETRDQGHACDASKWRKSMTEAMGKLRPQTRR
ncbi:hypothetical protein C8R46DRAFT_1023649 [Mycena filopes]|nr:hypothetical protein C8R46DRAFT_1023649 [Mycena filopes]